MFRRPILRVALVGATLATFTATISSDAEAQDAPAPADFVSAVLARLDLMSGTPDSQLPQQQAVSFSDLQFDVAAVATSYQDFSVDPTTGNAWLLPALLQQSAGNTSWLAPGAGPDAEERQITAVLGAMGWRRAAYVPATVVYSENDAKAQPQSTCNMTDSSSPGLLPSQGQIEQWQSQYRQALQGPWLLQTNGPTSLGVTTDGGSGSSTVTVYRGLVEAALPAVRSPSWRPATGGRPYRAWRSTAPVTCCTSSPAARADRCPA